MKLDKMMSKMIGDKAIGGLSQVLESIHAHLERQLETQEKILLELKKIRDNQETIQ